MKPKQKAEELFTKMYASNQPHTFDIAPSKRGAIVLVDEIIEALKITTGHLTINRLLERQEVQMDFDYWELVKKEIDKL